MNKIILVFVFLFSFLIVKSQKNSVVLTIEGDDIVMDEFKAIFYKNNHNTEITKEYLDDYMELFLNFKLKVREAKDLGLDTIKSFIDELKGYEKQLAKPYLQDSTFSNNMLNEAYNRIQYDIRASHILFGIDEKSNDTSSIYKKANDVRGQILNNELSFSEAAKMFSVDESVKSNNGDLGYFTAFMMVYPFESAAYNTKVGEISKPIRTKYGYHLVKVTDKRKALGKVEVAHIVFKTGNGANEQKKAEAYNKILFVDSLLKAGDSFQDLAEKYSEDRSSAVKGGVLPAFGVGRMVPDFEKASFSLRDIGDFSLPFETRYGWHIVYLINRQPIGSFNEIKNDLKRRIKSDSRGELSQKALINKLKKEYTIKHYKNSLEKLNKLARVDVAAANWDGKNAENLNLILFEIDKKAIPVKSFIEYLLVNQVLGSRVEDLYASFVNQQLLLHEENNLSLKYPEYKSLLNEYKEGILLFDLTNKKVWNKAIEDTLGLQQYFYANSANYMWGNRLRASVYTCRDLEVAKKVRYYLQKKERRGMNWINNILFKDTISQIDFLEKINVKSPLNLQIQNDKFLKGENKYIDQIDWKKGVSKDIKGPDGSIILVHIYEVLDPEEKLLSETKGKVISDYQNTLDEEWILELRNKYKYTINKETLYSLEYILAK